MKKFALAAIPLVLALAACGKSEDASTAAQADSVEAPADQAMAQVSDEPSADAAVTAEPTTAVDEAAQKSAEAAGASAAEVAARAQAAAAAANAATSTNPAN